MRKVYLLSLLLLIPVLLLIHFKILPPSETHANVTAKILEVTCPVEVGVGVSVPNPAAVYCKALCYNYDTHNSICRFNGESCDGFSFLRGDCGLQYTACAKIGGTPEIVVSSSETPCPYTKRCVYCKLPTGEYCSDYDIALRKCIPGYEEVYWVYPAFEKRVWVSVKGKKGYHSILLSSHNFEYMNYNAIAVASGNAPAPFTFFPHYSSNFPKLIITNVDLEKPFQVYLSNMLYPSDQPELLADEAYANAFYLSDTQYGVPQEGRVISLDGIDFCRESTCRLLLYGSFPAIIELRNSTSTIGVVNMINREAYGDLYTFSGDKFLYVSPPFTLSDGSLQLVLNLAGKYWEATFNLYKLVVVEDVPLIVSEVETQ